MTSNPFVESKELKLLYILALIVGLIKFNLGVGFAVGLTVSVLQHKLFAQYVDKIFFEEKFSVSTFISSYLFRFTLLTIALGASFLYSDYVDIYGVIFGLFVLKLWLYVKELAFKKGDNR